MFFLDKAVNSILETALSDQQLLVREFDVQDPDDPRFWLEVDVFYFPSFRRTEMYLRGGHHPVLTIKNSLVTDINDEPLGLILRDIVPTTLDVHLQFIPEQHIEVARISKFCSTIDDEHDFSVLIFSSIKDLKLK